MMRAGRWRLLAAALCIFAICGVVIYLRHNERATCMGIQILGEAEQVEFSEYEYCDFSSNLYYRGERAAVDIENSVIYISQEVSEKTKLWELAGKLELDCRQYRLYFTEPELNVSVAELMRDGEALRLLISDGSGKYMEYAVVLTSLPVVQMSGEITSVNDEGRDVWRGEFCIWSAKDPEVGAYTVKTSEVEWHIRGMTSATLPKKSWKLSIKNSDNEKQNLSLLGLGSDDDWLLNSMSLDDTSIKEKLMIDWWNEIVGGRKNDMKMSCGEYAEVVINGEYVGLYLVQRKLDAKYLELDDDDILIKGKAYIADSVKDMFDIVYSPLSEDETYALAEAIVGNNVYNMVDVEHFIDTNLMLCFASAIDNVGSKNMYYAFIYEDGEYTLYHIPWDTDITFGIAWTELLGYIYDYDASMNNKFFCSEYYQYYDKYPEIEAQMGERWRNLRGNILSDEKMCKAVDILADSLNLSGALKRNETKWGTYYGGEDTLENLKKYILERAEMFDCDFSE